MVLCLASTPPGRCFYSSVYNPAALISSSSSNSRSPLRNIPRQLLDLLFLRLEAERSQRHLQILQVDAALPVGIEEVERLPDLGLLRCGQLLLVSLGLRLLLAWARSGCAAARTLLRELWDRCWWLLVL